MTIFDEDTPLALIEAIRPDVLVKGGDYRPEEVVGREVVEAAGGRLVLIPLVDGPLDHPDWPLSLRNGDRTVALHPARPLPRPPPRDRPPPWPQPAIESSAKAPFKPSSRRSDKTQTRPLIQPGSDRAGIDRRPAARRPGLIEHVASRTGAVRLGAELLVVILVLACLAGTLALVVAMHRRQDGEITDSPVSVAPPPARARSCLRRSCRLPRHHPRQPAEDPTPGSWRLGPEGRAGGRGRAGRPEGRGPGRGAARTMRIGPRGAGARAGPGPGRGPRGPGRPAGEGGRGRPPGARRPGPGARRRQGRAGPGEGQHGGYAILPYKGPNGTWRRPIVIECRDGTAMLQPDGPSLTFLELATLRGVALQPPGRRRPARARSARRGPAPRRDARRPVHPFVVRPDGIRPFYEARIRLEPLGIAYGYELVDQDWEIEFPDLDDPSVWDSVAARRAGLAHAREGRGARGRGAGGSRARARTGLAHVPTDRIGAEGRDPVGSPAGAIDLRSARREDPSGWLGSSLRDPGRRPGGATSRGLEDSTPATPGLAARGPDRVRTGARLVPRPADLGRSHGERTAAEAAPGWRSSPATGRTSSISRPIRPSTRAGCSRETAANGQRTEPARPGGLGAAGRGAAADRPGRRAASRAWVCCPTSSRSRAHRRLGAGGPGVCAAGRTAAGPGHRVRAEGGDDPSRGLPAHGRGAEGGGRACWSRPCAPSSRRGGRPSRG